MKIENTNMRCPNCGENHWESVDKLRIKPAGMGVCVGCGFVSYPTKWQSAEAIKKHYRAGYRNPPSHQNMFAGQRKNHFHHKFLLELFDKWKEQGLENPKVLEIGAAYGMTLNWIKTLYPKAEVHGTELTTSFRRNAFHEFGIRLTEDIDESIKYDLIISYKVLEHQLDPDKELERYSKLLADGGHMYISVPTWFNSLVNFGIPGFDLEYYYDPNHINVWTREVFESIAQRAGWEIVKEDQVIYSSTYLMKPNSEKKSTGVVKYPKETVTGWMEKIYKAYMAFTEGKFDEAIALWPDYPNAWVSRAEMNRKELVQQTGDQVTINWDNFYEKYLEPAMKACPESTELVVMTTDFALRAKQFREATQFAEEALRMKPENPIALVQLANIMREMALAGKDLKEKLHYFTQAREVARHLRMVSSQHFKEATDMIYFYNSKLPFIGEDGATITEEAAKMNLALVKDSSPVELAAL